MAFKLDKKRAEKLAADQMNTVLCLTIHNQMYMEELIANRDRVVGSTCMHVLRNFHAQQKFFLNKCKSFVPKDIADQWDREYEKRDVTSLGDIMEIWSKADDEQRDELRELFRDLLTGKSEYAVCEEDSISDNK